MEKNVVTKSYPYDVKILLQISRRLRRKWQRTRNPHHKTALNKATKRLKSRINDFDTCKSNIDIIQRFQNKVLRLITNCSWYVRDSDLQGDIGIQPVADVIQKFQNPIVCASVAMSMKKFQSYWPQQLQLEDWRGRFLRTLSHKSTSDLIRLYFFL